MFIHEQGVPVELEWDGLDASCSHVLAWNDHERPSARHACNRNGTIGRMAVSQWRGRGVGKAPPKHCWIWRLRKGFRA